MPRQRKFQRYKPRMCPKCKAPYNRVAKSIVVDGETRTTGQLIRQCPQCKRQAVES